MVAEKNLDRILDPVDALNRVLEGVWNRLCESYDSCGEMPSWSELFRDMDLARPRQAARRVIARMLMEMTENIHRFSPYYTRPARAFGLTSMRNPTTRQVRWRLAPEACQKWQTTLDELAEAILRNSGLIQAVLLVEDYMENTSFTDPCVTAYCGCRPPRAIYLTETALRHSEIRCEMCLQEFE